MLDVQEKQQGDVTTLIFSGRVDSQGSVDLDLALQSALSEKKNKLILDMAEVRYMNSSGLRTLADILTQTREAGGDTKLVALNAKVRRVFEIIGFDNFFEIYETESDALSAFTTTVSP